MNQTLFQIWEVCIFRAGPQHLPNSYHLLVVLCAVGYGIDLALTQVVLPDVGGYWYLRPLMWFVLLGVATYGLLRFRDVPHRFLRTFIALNGTSLYLSSIALIVSTFLQEIADLLLLFLLLWQIMIHGSIIAISLKTKLRYGVAITILLVLLMRVFASFFISV